MLVGTQMLGQLVDTSGQDSDLNLGGAGIAFVSSVVQDNLGLLFLQNHGKYPPFKNVTRMPSRGGWCTEIQLSPATELRA